MRSTRLEQLFVVWLVSLILSPFTVPLASCEWHDLFPRRPSASAPVHPAGPFAPTLSALRPALLAMPESSRIKQDSFSQQDTPALVSRIVSPEEVADQGEPSPNPVRPVPLVLRI